MKDKPKKQTDRQRALDLILMRLSKYYQVNIPGEDVLEMYHESLEGYSIEQIASAATQHIKTCKWFPKICELIDILKPHVPELSSVAYEQAALVISMIGRYGYNHTPVWSDPITNHLFSHRFNWRSLCNTLTEAESKWFVKEFKEAYLSASDMCGGDTKLLEPPPMQVLPLLSMIGGPPERKASAIDIESFRKRVRVLKKNSPEDLEKQKQIILGSAS